MIATINGITVMGTPQEMWEYQKLVSSKEKTEILEDHREFIEKMRWKLNDNRQWDRGDSTTGQYILPRADYHELERRIWTIQSR